MRVVVSFLFKHIPACHKVFLFIYKSGVKDKLQITPNEYP